ncbi:hypothetical protein KJ786_01890 [Patescibacteria group bacterium]|nr:hypothetical protein [Patescibacteria group bacterium]
MKKITLLALLTIVGIFGTSQIVFADSSMLSVSPASLNSTVGKAFNVSVRIDPTGNKVCVIKGTLILNNLSCQAITVASGLYAITTPTCASPSFILGIPKCTTTAQSIISVSVKGVKAGQSNLSFTGVKVIGTEDVAFVSQGGAYNIAVASAQTTTPNVIQQTPTQEETTTPTQEETFQEATPENNILPNTQTATLVATSSRWINVFWVLLSLVIVACAVYAIYRLKGKKK